MATFTMTSNRMRVTDPCYDRDTSCIGILENVLPGVWEATQLVVDEGAWGNRVKELRVSHSNFWHIEPNSPTRIDVGVDSGQAGFFDDALYPDIPGDYDDQESFYRKICNYTLGEEGSDIPEFGVASSSGYGDGSYDCFVGYNSSGQIVSAKIVFISDDDEEDELNYYEEYEDE